ncbi:MFS transporter [Duganella sp. SAP-35]|uniref:MFS transporter n=2 Tax=Duganella aceris TaxID=2703883 RepID=A0ABX0FKN1_9BURK|nr:MFS transporter [Duganella aceris]
MQTHHISHPISTGDRSKLPSSRPPAAMWASAALVAAVFMLSNSATPLYEHWQREFGFSPGTLTLIFSMYIVGLIGSLLFAGQISDRYGRRPVLIPGLLIGAMGSLLFANAASVLTLCVARMASGVAVGVIVSAGMAAVADLGGVQHRRRAALAASVSMVLGAGLGPLFAGTVAHLCRDPAWLVFTIEFVILLLALLLACLLPLPRVHSAHGTGARLWVPTIPRVNRAHLACGMAVFGPGISATAFMLALGPTLLTELTGAHNPLLAGGITCLMFFSAACVQFFVRGLSPQRILTLGAISVLLAMSALLFSIQMSMMPAMIASALLAGAGQGLGQLGGFTLISLHVAQARRAEANALLNIGAFGLAGVSTITAGYWINIYGLSVAVTLFSLVMACLGVAGAYLIPKLLDLPRPQVRST